MGITFQGIDNGSSSPSVRTQAFSLSAVGAVTPTVQYDATTPPPDYIPYLVMVSSYSPDTGLLKFAAVNLNTGVPSGSFQVQFGDWTSVWPGPPSTSLQNYSPANNYAIILLSDTFVNGDADLVAAQAGPTTPNLQTADWPKNPYYTAANVRKKLHEFSRKANLSDDDRALFTSTFGEYLR